MASFELSQEVWEACSVGWRRCCLHPFIAGSCGINIKAISHLTGPLSRSLSPFPNRAERL